MVEYSNKTFTIVTKTILVVNILSSIGALINGRMFTWGGVLAVILLYGIMAKKDWINEGTRVFGAFLLYSTIIQIRSLLKQPFDYLIGSIIIVQASLFVYGFISLFYASKFIKTVNPNNVAT